MKRYGCLLAVLAFVFSSAAMAKTVTPQTNTATFNDAAGAGSIMGSSHNFKSADGEPANDEWEGPGLVHCQVGVGCTVKTIAKKDKCAGKPILVSCQVGKGCEHSCNSEDEASSSTHKTNRKAASVQKNDTN